MKVRERLKLLSSTIPDKIRFQMSCEHLREGYLCAVIIGAECRNADKCKLWQYGKDLRISMVFFRHKTSAGEPCKTYITILQGFSDRAIVKTFILTKHPKIFKQQGFAVARRIKGYSLVWKADGRLISTWEAIVGGIHRIQKNKFYGTRTS